jgi:hypothetical protein
MAITQKLVYAASLEAFKKACTDWESKSSSIYYSIVFTADGYIVTHGKVIKGSVIGTGGTGDYALEKSYSGTTK